MTANILYANSNDDYCAGYKQNVDNIYLGYAVSYQLLVAGGQDHQPALFHCPADNQYWKSLKDNFNGFPPATHGEELNGNGMVTECLNSRLSLRSVLYGNLPNSI